jgi:hypothetical protein
MGNEERQPGKLWSYTEKEEFPFPIYDSLESGQYLRLSA